MRGSFEESSIVGSQSREQRHEVSPRHDIDGVDLELRQSTGDCLDIPHGDWSLQSRDPKSLRSERNPPRLSVA
jgi:hypothetical protein